jgi:hypothetical protein
MVGVLEIMSTNDNPTTDLFHWANQTDAQKRDMDVEIFVFSKNYTPYFTSIGDALVDKLKSIFLYDAINYVNMGAAAGLVIRPIEEAAKEKGVVYHANISDVGRADTLIHLIENERNDIVHFNNEEHEFKRLKGFVAVFTHPTDKNVKFYIIKQINIAGAVSDSVGWQLTGGVFNPLQVDIAFNPPLDNQVLVVGGDIFIFNTDKFTQLFNHDARALKEIERIGAEIDEQYDLSMPTIGQGITFMAKEKPALIKKLLAVQPGLVSQEQVITTADDFAIELMTDDQGKIILMDNFYSSDATGITYLAKSKKMMDESHE